MIQKDNFNFIEVWINKDKKAIVDRIHSFYECEHMIIQPHFDSELLIIHKPCFAEIDLCRMLNIPYETYYGANTIMGENMVLNVSKVMKDNVIGRLIR